MSDRWDALREAAEQATPGPWFVSGVRTTMDRQRWLRVLREPDEWEVAFIPYGDRTDAEHIRATAHARLIAAANPSAIADLLAERDALERELVEARRDAERLRAALGSAIEYVESWASYASPYFQEKHDLEGDLATLRAAMGRAE